MRALGRTSLVVALAADLLAAASAGAAIRCVNTTGTGGCFTSIAAAVNAAAAGDTVTVAPGVYQENGTIAVAQDGLKIVGPPTAIVDPESLRGPNAFVPLYVSGNNVAVTGLTFRNGTTDAIQVAGSHFTLTGVTVNGAEGLCLLLLPGAHDATVKSSHFRNCVGGGIVFGDAVAAALVDNLSIQTSTFGNLGSDAIGGVGNYASITGNTMQTLGGAGIRIPQGTSPAIKANTIRDVLGPAIQVGGQSAYSAIVQGASITFNRVTGAGGGGILLYGGAAELTNNTVTSVRGNPVYLFGASSTLVKANVVTGGTGYGIYSEDAASQTLITNNTISGTRFEPIFVFGPNANDVTVSLNHIIGNGGYDGIFVNGPDSTVVGNDVKNCRSGVVVYGGGSPNVSSNRVSNGIGGYGIVVFCSGCGSGLTVKLNRVTDLADEGVGVDVFSDGNGGLVQGNVVTRTALNGFALYGTGLSILSNQSIDSGFANAYDAAHGFSFGGSGLTITGNLSRGSGADGFYLAADNSTINSNTADHNAEDGFDVHAPGSNLTGNHATFNNGSGFEIDSSATSVSLLSNTVVGAGAVGLCNAGGAALSFNNFGSAANPPASGQCDAASGFIGN